MESVGFHVQLRGQSRASSGTERLMRAHRFDPHDVTSAAKVPVLCVHGLSANARGFDPLGRHLAERGHRAVAVDLRGRGESACSGPGTYGWRAHARDLLDVADGLDAKAFDLVGHSMGAFVAMQLVEEAGARVRRLVLLDGLGMPEAASMPPILSSVQRLSGAYASVEAYLSRVRSLGTIEPWSADWECYFRYELQESEGGSVRPRTSSAAVLEDAFYGSTQDPRTFWGGIRMPALVVRAARPLGNPGGFIVSAQDRDEFLRRVPGARAVEVDANHYGVLMHATTLDAIGSFLS